MAIVIPDVMDPGFEVWTTAAASGAYKPKYWQDTYDDDGWAAAGYVGVARSTDASKGSYSMEIEIDPGGNTINGMEQFAIAQFGHGVGLDIAFFSADLKIVESSSDYSIVIIDVGLAAAAGTYHTPSGTTGWFTLSTEDDDSIPFTLQSSPNAAAGFAILIVAQNDTTEVLRFRIDNIVESPSGSQDMALTLTNSDPSEITSYHTTVICDAIYSVGADIYLETYWMTTPEMWELRSSSGTKTLTYTLASGNVLYYRLTVDFAGSFGGNYFVDFSKEELWVENTNEDYYCAMNGNNDAYNGWSKTTPFSSITQMASTIPATGTGHIDYGDYPNETAIEPANLTDAHDMEYIVSALGTYESGDLFPPHADKEVIVNGEPSGWLQPFEYSSLGSYTLYYVDGQHYTRGLTSAACTFVDSDMLMDSDEYQTVLWDSDTEFLIYLGAALIFNDGFALYPVSFNSTHDVVMFELRDNGTTIDTVYIDEADLPYVYTYEDNVGGNDVITIAANITIFFYGTETSSVTFEGVWQASDTFTTI